MRYGIPLLGQRVAPRISSADSILLATVRDHRVIAKDILPFAAATWIDLPKSLAPFHVDALVCGGIDQESKKDLFSNAVDIIDNVACDVEGVLIALETNSLHSGYGFQTAVAGLNSVDSESAAPENTPNSRDMGIVLSEIDCIDCRNRLCLQGKACPSIETFSIPCADGSMQDMLDAAADISLEEECTLCRISELVYFCIEMKYRKIGIAFCADLLEPTEILSRLLRRHFDIYPVICKVGGISVHDPFYSGKGKADKERTGITACNPLGQAEILNRLNTDLNLIVGLCMGVDCVFTKASMAPVTTLFVKDKSLVNNPIGALYSEYYLKEVTQTPIKMS